MTQIELDFYRTLIEAAVELTQIEKKRLKVEQEILELFRKEKDA